MKRYKRSRRLPRFDGEGKNDPRCAHWNAAWRKSPMNGYRMRNERDGLSKCTLRPG